MHDQEQGRSNPDAQTRPVLVTSCPAAQPVWADIGPAHGGGYGLPHWHVGGSSTADMVAASSAVTGARAVRILLVLRMKLLPVLARAWLPRKLDLRICRSIRGLILGSRGGWGARLYGGAWGQPAEAAPSNADIKPVSLHGPPLSAGSRPDRETRPERAVYGCARFSRGQPVPSRQLL